MFTSATNEGRKEAKAEEGGMVDNSGSSKAQMVSAESGPAPALLRLRALSLDPLSEQNLPVSAQ